MRDMAGQNQASNMEQFELYFRRADLDKDGRISGAEAVSFFQGSNLPKQVLAQIWTHADQNQIGSLGRAEFYNALKLVTVAQSKRELTPDLVKAALYGPASAKIPAPQINFAAVPSIQSNLGGVPTDAQLSGSGRAVAASQSPSILRPQVSSQETQLTRPPRPPSPNDMFLSQMAGTGQGMAGVRPPSSIGSIDWPDGAAPAAAGVNSQVLAGVSPPLLQSGFGPTSGLAPSTRPRPLATTELNQHVAPKPNGPTFNPYQAGFKDSSSVIASGNGSVANSAFESSSGPRAPQNTGSQNHQEPSAVKQNQQVSVPSFPLGAGNSGSGQSQLPWPRMTQLDVQKYTKVFIEVDTDKDGKITGEQARSLFLSWRLPREILKHVWDLSDQDNDSMLSLKEFCIALYLMERYREGRPLPRVLPTSVIFEDSLSLAPGQPVAANSISAWRPSPGLQQAQGLTGPRAVAPPAGGRPPRPVPIPQSDEELQPRSQMPRVPVLEKHLVDQLSTEEQTSLNSKFHEATEADRKVGELEKDILESREKIEFYRSKLQELVLYKSRCDNRLNEITERISADKGEVESLAKNYEEKYKQAGDVASKLTIEEATFRDIQEKKMELYRAILKLELDGSADDIQGRVDHIKTNLEEQVKALNERCKMYGLRAKPTTLLELPFGWQPGIQGGAADWDEHWDKFEDEGYSFVKELTLDVQNVIALPKSKSLPVQSKAIAEEGVTAAVSSSADVKSERLPAEEGTSEEESSNVRVGKESKMETPPDSPASGSVVDSTSKRSPDSPAQKNFDRENSSNIVETQRERGGADSVLSVDRSFDEPGWGTFDTHYDTDVGWDLDPIKTKDTDHERHDDGSFFVSDDWGLNPIRTEVAKKTPFPFADSVPSTPAFSYAGSPRGDGYLFQQKIPTFGLADSVPGTPAYGYMGSPRSDNIQKQRPFAFADSVPSTPMFNSDNSPKRFSDGPEDHSFGSISRFDSFSSSIYDGGLFAPKESSLARFDSIRSTRDSEFDQGFFPPRESSLTRFDSIRSTTADSDFGRSSAFSGGRDSFARYDSMRSTADSDFGRSMFPSFDEPDPFGSSDSFRASAESQTPRKNLDGWRAF